MKSTGHQNILDNTMKTQDRSIKGETDAHTYKSSMTGIPPAPEPSQQLLRRSPQDIVCGRGLHIQCHQGNSKLHQIVNRYRQTYHTSSRKEKFAIAHRIVNEIKSSGSRFIRQVEDDNNDDRWEEVSNDTAYRKVGHALRLRKDYQPRTKRKVRLETSQSATANQDLMVASFDGTMSAALHHGIVAPSSAAAQIPIMASVPSVLPSGFLPDAFHPLFGNQLRAAGRLMTPQTVSPLQYPSWTPSLLNPYYGQQLLTNPLLANVFHSTLNRMAYASIQHSLEALQAGHQLLPPEGGDYEQSLGSQESSRTLDKTG